ncbi:MAG TPA: isochorismate lyase [Oculatellaceae cyanobacterium]
MSHQKSNTFDFPNMKAPEQCHNIDEIRVQIDTLDKQVINLLGQRFGYVKAASKFKTSETSVRAPERFEAMLEQRRAWAEDAGLSPEAIEKMYRDLVNYFIEEEIKNWQDKDDC